MSVTQLCPTLYNPMDCSPPASSVHGILQARILEWVAIPNTTNPDCVTFCKTTDLMKSLIINSQKLCLSSIKRSCCCCCLVSQSCPTLCDPLDCSPPASSVHGILQARILEWATREAQVRARHPPKFSPYPPTESGNKNENHLLECLYFK